MDVESRLVELGIELPEASGPAANYSNCVQTGNLLYVSGKGPAAVGAEVPRGKLGREYTVEEGYACARRAGLDILAVVRLHLGSLNRVARVVKVQGFVNATPEFEQHPQVLDGCSDLFAEVFGECGLHARSVFGATSLRGNLPVIVDSIFEVEAGEAAR